MICGGCGGTFFEVALGRCHCRGCGASVDNEVASALQAGFPPGHIKFYLADDDR